MVSLLNRFSINIIKILLVYIIAFARGRQINLKCSLKYALKNSGCCIHCYFCNAVQVLHPNRNQTSELPDSHHYVVKSFGRCAHIAVKHALVLQQINQTISSLFGSTYEEQPRCAHPLSQRPSL